MSDLMADYERVLAMLQRAGIPFTTSRDHEVITVGEDGKKMILRFNVRGALVRWDPQESSDTKESEPPQPPEK